MSESKSRYAIVSDLTQQKLKFLDENSCLDSKIEDKEQELINYQKEFISWEKEAQEDIVRDKRNRENILDKIKAEIEFLKKNKQKKEDTIAIKLTEIDKALERLETISKAALTEEKQ